MFCVEPRTPFGHMPSFQKACPVCPEVAPLLDLVLFFGAPCVFHEPGKKYKVFCWGPNSEGALNVGLHFAHIFWNLF